MTRGLRKRHLIMWIALAIILSVLMVKARQRIPIFKGDQSTEQVSP